MTPEISILKLILKHEEWSKVNEKLSIQDFPKELQPIYSSINNYHVSSTDPHDLSSSDLCNLVFSNPVKDKEYVELVLTEVDQCTATANTTLQLIKSLQKRRLLKQISLSAYEIAEGRQQSSELENLITAWSEDSDESADTQGEDSDFLQNNLDTIVNKVIKVPGLRWRLNTMNQMLGSLRKGNFGFVFARPESGKTTFLSSEVTHMVEQLKEEDGPAIWFNNEQVGEEVLLRLYQASLGRDTSALLSDISSAQQEYITRTHDKLKLVDRAQLHYRYIDSVCKKYKPSLVLIDQIDAIQGFDADRKDLQLGAIYRWARELAKQYCPVVAVCQADGTGEGQMWLTMANVADAKTAKQAHADWILGIGKKNQDGYDNIRYLHLSKNKLLGDEDTNPTMRHGRREVLIEPTIARFKDI